MELQKRKKRRIGRTSTSTSTAKTKTGWLPRFNPDGTFKKDRILIDRKNFVTNIVDRKLFSLPKVFFVNLTWRIHSNYFLQFSLKYSFFKY
jgi:hypothetical protein